MRVLVVGAGAVGQTFGFHLQQGGAEVDFLVKPKYADEARRGYTVYDLRRRGFDAPLRFTDFGVVTGPDEVRAKGYDLVLITVSSAALGGDWLAPLLEASGDATIVGMQPGPGDWDRVRAIAGAERTVWGVIELIAYQAPLQGETVAVPGVAFWIPRWLLFPFSGADSRVQPLVQAFRDGGLRSRQVADTTALTAVGAPAMNLHMAALEASGWSVAALAADHELLALTGEAVREATAGAARQQGISVPVWVRWMRPWQLRALAWLAPRVVPVDLDTYLRFHFTKVGEQTELSLDRWIETAEAAGLPSAAMRQIRELRAGQQQAA